MAADANPSAAAPAASAAAAPPKAKGQTCGAAADLRDTRRRLRRPRRRAACGGREATRRAARADHERIIDSGDNAADRAVWARFVEYDASTRSRSGRHEGDAAHRDHRLADGDPAGQGPQGLGARRRRRRGGTDRPAHRLSATSSTRSRPAWRSPTCSASGTPRSTGRRRRRAAGTPPAALVSGKRDGLYLTPAAAGEDAEPGWPYFAAADPKAVG